MGEWEFGWGVKDAGKEDCDVIIANTYQTPFIHHFALEPYSVMAAFTNGVLEIKAAIQHPFFLRKILSELLELPPEKVRVVAMEMGGGFGGRGYPKLEPLAAVLAIKTNRKIKLKLDGDESFLQGQREASQINIETGFDARGKIKFQTLEANFLIGAYADISPRVVQKAGFLGSGPYLIPNLAVVARGLFSNNTPTTAFRGFGATHITFAIESQMNQAARRLGIDPIAIRLINLPDKGDSLIPQDSPVDGEWKTALEKAANLIAWGQDKNPINHRGIAIGIKSSVPATVSHAKVKLKRSGKLNAYVGTTEMGQGSRIVMARIVAAQFGIPPGKVKVIAGDTARVPLDTITASSRSTVMMGSALVSACDDIKNKIDEGIGQGRTVSSGAEKDGETFAATEENKRHYETYLNRPSLFPNDLTGRGVYKGAKDSQHPLGGPAAFWEYIVTAVEVVIDPDLGTIELRKLVNVSDAGKVINPARAVGQDEGGAIMAIGAALMEQLIFSDTGKLLNGNALDYKIPTSKDIPREMVTVFQENGDGPGPDGCKGIGESGILACLPAITGAIYNATGILIDRIPVSPENLWRKMNT
jgi:CO/xanthine dehydrogenase Mo-binding subunit